MLDFAPNEEQVQFQRSARDFLKREGFLDRVREVERSALGYDAALYRKMVSLGWLSVGVPKGGSSDWVMQSLLYEEMGRSLCVTPHFPSTVVVAGALREFAVGQSADLLPSILSGDRIATWVWPEIEGQAGIEARLSRGNHILRGVCEAVVLGHAADAMIVIAFSSSSAMLCLVTGKGTGLTATPVPGIGGFGLAAVEFRDAPAVVLAEGAGMLSRWRTLMLHSRLLLAAEMLGGAEVSLEMAVDYAKHRVAFGRPIGSFQALQHKLANMKLAVEGARALVYYAATLLIQGKSADASIAAAQLQAVMAYRQAATEAVQVFGGIGVMDESAISMYFRRAKALELLLGPTEALQECIAMELEAPDSRETALTLLR